MKINIKLDTRSTKMAIRNLKRYHKQLQEKCNLFVDKLLDEGISTARLNCGEYGQFITFTKSFGGNKDTVKGTLTAVGTPVIRERGNKVYEVDPLLMAEFGSGWEAEVLDNVSGVGQGTFPGQTHAFDPRGWWYTDDSGNTVHSYGESPTFPMHSASIAMLFAIDTTIKEVFGSGR